MLGGTFLLLIQLIFLSSVCSFKKLQRYATFGKLQTSAIVWTHYQSFVRLVSSFPRVKCSSKKNVNISPEYYCDHALGPLELKVDDIKRAKPMWKFNNSLLLHKEYLKLVKDTILKVKQLYSLPQEREMSSTRHTHLEGYQIYDQLFFEMILLEIRGKTISYETYKKKQARQKENELRS